MGTKGKPTTGPSNQGGGGYKKYTANELWRIRENFVNGPNRFIVFPSIFNETGNMNATLAFGLLFKQLIFRKDKSRLKDHFLTVDMGTFQRLLGFAPKTVSRALGILEKHNLIQREKFTVKGGGTVSKVRILVQNLTLSDDRSDYQIKIERAVEGSEELAEVEGDGDAQKLEKGDEKSVEEEGGRPDKNDRYIYIKIALNGLDSDPMVLTADDLSSSGSPDPLVPTDFFSAEERKQLEGLVRQNHVLPFWLSDFQPPVNLVESGSDSDLQKLEVESRGEIPIPDRDRVLSFLVCLDAKGMKSLSGLKDQIGESHFITIGSCKPSAQKDQADLWMYDPVESEEPDPLPSLIPSHSERDCLEAHSYLRRIFIALPYTPEIRKQIKRALGSEKVTLENLRRYSCLYDWALVHTDHPKISEEQGKPDSVADLLMDFEFYYRFAVMGATKWATYNLAPLDPNPDPRKVYRWRFDWLKDQINFVTAHSKAFTYSAIETLFRNNPAIDVAEFVEAEYLDLCPEYLERILAKKEFRSGIFSSLANRDLSNYQKLFPRLFRSYMDHRFEVDDNREFIAEKRNQLWINGLDPGSNESSVPPSGWIPPGWKSPTVPPDEWLSKRTPFKF